VAKISRTEPKGVKDGNVKAAYLGGMRGQSAVYRPGIGWSGSDRRRRLNRRPAAAIQRRSVFVNRPTGMEQRRSGWKTRVLILFSVAGIAAGLTVVLGGGFRL